MDSTVAGRDDFAMKSPSIQVSTHMNFHFVYINGLQGENDTSMTSPCSSPPALDVSEYSF